MLPPKIYISLLKQTMNKQSRTVDKRRFSTLRVASEVNSPSPNEETG
jgi:hypothetical protein